MVAPGEPAGAAAHEEKLQEAEEDRRIRAANTDSAGEKPKSSKALGGLGPGANVGTEAASPGGECEPRALFSYPQHPLLLKES